VRRSTFTMLTKGRRRRCCRRRTASREWMTCSGAIGRRGLPPQPLYRPTSGPWPPSTQEWKSCATPSGSRCCALAAASCAPQGGLIELERKAANNHCTSNVRTANRCFCWPLLTWASRARTAMTIDFFWSLPTRSAAWWASTTGGLWHLAPRMRTGDSIRLYCRMRLRIWRPR